MVSLIGLKGHESSESNGGSVTKSTLHHVDLLIENVSNDTLGKPGALREEAHHLFVSHRTGTPSAVRMLPSENRYKIRPSPRRPTDRTILNSLSILASISYLASPHDSAVSIEMAMGTRISNGSSINWRTRILAFSINSGSLGTSNTSSSWIWSSSRQP